jgi:hypothetical protein
VSTPFTVWLRKPLGWKQSVLLFFLATWPVLVWFASPVWFYLELFVVHFVAACFSLFPALFLLVLRHHFRDLAARKQSHAPVPEHWPKRVAIASVILFAFHATSLPLRAIFWIHYPWLEQARLDALAQAPAGTAAVTLPGKRIGLYTFTKIHVNGNALPYSLCPGTVAFEESRDQFILAANDQGKFGAFTVPPIHVSMGGRWYFHSSD